MKFFSKYKSLISVFFLLCGLTSALYIFSNRTYFYQKAASSLFGRKANLVVNLTDSYNIESYPWRNFAQGGEESDGMLAPVVEKMKVLQPEYIRIDHVYDFYEVVKRDSSGRLIYDWSKLDSELVAIITTGAKPFLSLSYMPKAMSSGSEVDLPISWDEWRFLVQKTIEHVSGTDGLAIANVYYEVWNEPDLFGNFKTKGPKNYLELYEHAAIGASNARGVLPYKLGGPATATLYKNWFYNFFEHVQNNNLRVDFYSWHRYSRYLNDYENDFRNVKEWILDYPEYANIEFLITESGFDSEVNADYDNAYSAMHTLAVSVTNFQQIPKVFSFEIKDGPGDKKYWGRWGILTHENFGEPTEKPRYRAFEFLNEMKGKRYVILGQGTWVKALAITDDEKIKVLVVNYDPFESHFESIPINFVNIPWRRFNFKRIDFLGETSQVLVSTEQRTWTTNVLMQPNTAAIFELTPR
jgi:hypothetical protein